MHPGRVAFVLGGGGVHGACEVGMLRALSEAGVVPDLILGTSVGAINGAMFAKDPGEAGVIRLGDLWEKLATGEVFGLATSGAAPRVVYLLGPSTTRHHR